MKNLFDLHRGQEEKEKVLANIKSNISFTGSNLWILACAIIIASVGLNVNSTAVIIGAMLISPLMGPIVGAGFALGTYDFALLQKSIKSLFIATFVSLFVAILYFSLSPFKETQSEILARTSPNIYDVIIAFVGGLVGVITLTRVEKGNPIPGVAIATALMPPLCTAGYGLAIGNLTYFSGAFYLYCINCFFICFATLMIVKYLDYPIVHDINPQIDKRIRYSLTTLMIVMIIPSFYLAYNLYNEKKYSEQVQKFIYNEFTIKGQTIVHQKIQFNKNPKEIELAFLNTKFTPQEVSSLNQKISKMGLGNIQLNIIQDTTDLKDEILREIDNRSHMERQKNIELDQLKKSIDQYTFNDPDLWKELKVLFPEIDHASMGRHTLSPDASSKDDTQQSNLYFVYSLQNKDLTVNEEKLRNWLKLKLQIQDLGIIKIP